MYSSLSPAHTSTSLEHLSLPHHHHHHHNPAYEQPPTTLHVTITLTFNATNNRTTTTTIFSNNKLFPKTLSLCIQRERSASQTDSHSDAAMPYVLSCLAGSLQLVYCYNSLIWTEGFHGKCPRGAFRPRPRPGCTVLRSATKAVLSHAERVTSEGVPGGEGGVDDDQRGGVEGDQQCRPRSLSLSLFLSFFLSH